MTWPWESSGSVDDFECDKCGQSGNWLEPQDHRMANYHGYTNLCRGCAIDLQKNPDVWRPHLFYDDFRYFYGCASGGSKKALVKMEESHVMLNWQTKNNVPPSEHPDAPDDYDPVLFTDSGGSPQSFEGDYDDVSMDDYLEYVREYSDLWTLWDYPVEQELLDKFDRTVEDHQRRTTDEHIRLLDEAQDRGITAQPISVIQGQTIDQYLDHLDDLQAHDVLTDYVAVGSVCARTDAAEIRDVILALREAIPSRCKFHAYGVKLGALKYRDVLSALDSADSCSYDYNLRQKAETSDQVRYVWESITHEYLGFRKKIGELIAEYGSDSVGEHDRDRRLIIDPRDEGQSNLGAFGDGGDGGDLRLRESTTDDVRAKVAGGSDD